MASLEARSEPEPSRCRRFVFGDFDVDLQRGSLTRDGAEISLRPKSFAVLHYLLERAGQLVAREELLAAVWPGVVVTDDSVAQCLIELRRALGDDKRAIIRTVPRRGLIFDVPVRLEESAEPPPKRGSRKARRGWLLLAGLAAVAVIVVLLWWLEARQTPESPAEANASTPVTNSIAVLRFTDMSPGGDQSYLADGLSEEIMHRLAQSPSLRVIARVSSFAVEGEPIAVIAKQLDVSHVLEGSVRKQGNEIRVTAQLVDTATRSQIWSKTFDRKLIDIFVLQDEIAGAVARALQVRLTDAGSRTDIDPLAYELFLEARYLYRRRADGDLAKAQQRFEEALSMSPEFARAWAGLSAVAAVKLAEERYSENERNRLLEMQRHAVEQALRFGPTLPEAHIRAARYYYQIGEKALSAEHVEIARSLNPDHWLFRMTLAAELITAGRIDESIPLIRHEVQRDPLNPTLRENIVTALIWAQRFDDAQAELDAMLELFQSPEDRAASLSRTSTLLQILMGDFGAAAVSIEAMPEGMERSQLRAVNQYALGFHAASNAALGELVSEISTPGDAVYAAEVHAYRGESPAALAWLRRIEFGPGCELRGLASRIYYSPLLDKLSGTPAWETYRAEVLRFMQGCTYGLKIDRIQSLIGK